MLNPAAELSPLRLKKIPRPCMAALSGASNCKSTRPCMLRECFHDIWGPMGAAGFTTGLSAICTHLQPSSWRSSCRYIRYKSFLPLNYPLRSIGLFLILIPNQFPYKMAAPNYERHVQVEILPGTEVMDDSQHHLPASPSSSSLTSIYSRRSPLQARR